MNGSAPSLAAAAIDPVAARLVAADGCALGATWYAASNGGDGDGAMRGDPPVVLLVPATGVLRRLYDPFARFLAGQGLAALTWDWRGTGESRPRSLRGFAATMSDWATLDLAAAIAEGVERAAGAPLLAVGHSFGGQCLGLAPGAEHLRAAVTVAAQSGWWGHWPAPRRYAYATLWHLVMPGVTHALGYFPARRFGLGEDLPRGVALQWARWCRSPRYLGDYAGHQRLRLPILALGFADDDYAPRGAVEALHREYGGPVALRHLQPAELGVPRVGHFGFFKPGLPALWREVAGWLRARAADAAGAGTLIDDPDRPP